eukprot:14350822-Heterocapsa_arctica.AAC.1
MAKATRDLGIDVIAGRRRSTVIASTKFDKARVRASGVAGLAMVNPKAKKLTATGTVPQATWGRSATGLSEQVINEV